MKRCQHLFDHSEDHDGDEDEGAGDANERGGLHRLIEQHDIDCGCAYECVLRVSVCACMREREKEREGERVQL